MDVLLIYDSSWFGRPTQKDVDVDPSPPPAQLHRRRASASSLADLAAAAEQGGEGPAAVAPRDRRQHGPQSASQQQPLNLQRHSASGRLHQGGRGQEDDDGVLGTWAGRQRIFSEHLRGQERLASTREQEEADEAPEPRGAHPPHQPASQRQTSPPQQVQERAGGSPAAVVLRPPGPARTAERGDTAHGWPEAQGQRSQQAGAQPPIDVLDQEMNAAWRWRFTRKWQAEQMKQFEGPAGAGAGREEGEDEEEWAAALRMMDAVDGGLNMQIGRTLSLHNSSVADTGGSMGQSLSLMSPGLQYMLLDSSVKESPLRAEDQHATTAIVSVARKAQHLRRQQQEIERQVTERWEAAAGGTQWVAQHLPAVQIDSWSAFPFVLVRLSEPQRSQRQKLLVRGRNGSTEQEAFAAAEQEAARAAISHRLPGPRVELVAAGRMEWVAAALGSSQGQRRTLRVRISRLLPPAAKDPRLHSLAGASGVVAELTRASFPRGDFDIVAPEGAERQVARAPAAASVAIGAKKK